MSVVVFTDRDLGSRFPAILKDSGINVERHADHFSPATPDEEWLSVVGQHNWVALTHDRRIRYKPNELAAVMRYKVALLVVIGAAPYPELAHSFIATWPRIRAFISQHEPPYIAKVYRARPAEPVRGVAPGRIELWHPKDRSS